MRQPQHALTIRADRLANVIKCEVEVAQAFDLNRGDDPKPMNKFIGIWDTGASASVISQKVVDNCGLKPIGIAHVYTASGQCSTERYLVNIKLPASVGFKNILVTRGELHGCDVLIGMDIITVGDFAITNATGKTVCSFRVPSTQEIDFVKEIDAAKHPKPYHSEKTGRNSLCPCGSGKKYKYCCGLNR